MDSQQDQTSASSEFIHDQKRHNLKCMFVDTGHIASHRETDEGKDGGRRYVHGGKRTRNGGNTVKTSQSKQRLQVEQKPGDVTTASRMLT